MEAQEIVTVILGGGQGTRLFPLTKDRAKPAVPLAGKYRLIDIPVSNCINSGLRMIYVLTMYQSASLNSHIYNAYRFDHFTRGFVDILAAEQTRQGGTWFQGTADAVRQQWHHINRSSPKHVLILSGDHLYRMKYMDFVRVHEGANAHASIAVQPVSRQEAPQLGLLKVDETGKIIKFMEKPKEEEALDEMMVDTSAFGLSPEQARERPFLASMGIYLFKARELGRILAKDAQQTDFGKHILPELLETMHVQAFCFDGYWADIGTVRAFYECNIDLVSPLPKFNLFDPKRPIYTNSRYLPGAKLNQASVEAVVLCDGAIVERAMVRNSILGVRSRVQPGATIESTLVMGADYYESTDSSQIGIGEGAYIKKSIIDKNAWIGRGAQLVNRDNVETYDDPEHRFYVRDGIIVVPKGGRIPDGFVF